MGEIAAASNEQAQGIEQMNTAVNEIDKVTQQNAANAEESASASEEMSAQAEQMKVIVKALASIVGKSADAGLISGSRGRRSECKSKPGLSSHKTDSVPVKKTKKEEVEVFGAKELNPDQIIPMDEEDFKNF